MSPLGYESAQTWQFSIGRWTDIRKNSKSGDPLFTTAHHEFALHYTRNDHAATYQTFLARAASRVGSVRCDGRIWCIWKSWCSFVLLVVTGGSCRCWRLCAVSPSDVWRPGRIVGKSKTMRSRKWSVCITYLSLAAAHSLSLCLYDIFCWWSVYNSGNMDGSRVSQSRLGGDPTTSWC